MIPKSFPNYYEILQVNPKADRETIERVYRLLAKRYHPDSDNKTGDSTKFESIVEAYRVLSNPERRVTYDKSLNGNNGSQPGNSFTFQMFRDPESEKKIYQAILLTLYIARRKDVMKPGVGIVDLEKLLNLAEKELEFHIWYLKEKGWIEREESGGFAITASGVDAVIEYDILINKDKLLTFNGSVPDNSSGNDDLKSEG